MNEEKGGIFKDLTPPPGGIQALRNRLDGETGRRAHRWVYLTSCTAAAGLMALLLTFTSLPTMRSEGEPALRIDAELNPALIRLGVAEATGEPVSVPRDHRRRMAVERVDVESPKVVFYRVAVIEDPGLPAT